MKGRRRVSERVETSPRHAELDFPLQPRRPFRKRGQNAVCPMILWVRLFGAENGMPLQPNMSDICLMA
jgi:hypothetical protein